MRRRRSLVSESRQSRTSRQVGVAALSVALILAGCSAGDSADPATATADPVFTIVTPTPRSQTSPPAAEANRPRTYAVQPGDTLSAIAAQFGVSAAELRRINGIDDPDSIRVGQSLLIPTPRAR